MQPGAGVPHVLLPWVPHKRVEEYDQQLLSVMNRAFQNKCGSTLGKLLLVTYIDIPNKISSHTCFVTDTAFPWICNNQNLVREISKVLFFFPQEKTIAHSFIPPA